MHRLRRSALHAALCTVALFVQAIVLPLAHSRHEGSAARRVDRSPPLTAAAPGAATLGDASAVPATHDTADCALCATLAHGRAGVVPAALRAPLAVRALPVSNTALLSDAGRMALASGGPRAPPHLSA